MLGSVFAIVGGLDNVGYCEVIKRLLVSFEEGFVDLFEMENLFSATSDVVLNHQLGKMLPVNENDAIPEIFCRLDGRWAKV